MHPVESPVAPRFSPALAGLALACGALACLLWLAAASPAAAQNLVGTPIPVSGGLITNGLAVDATTNRVYVSVGDSCDSSNNCGGIAIIDGNTNTASATHIHPPSGTPPTGCCVNYFGDLAVDPSIHRLFVNGIYRVNAIDTTTNLPAGSSPVFTCGLNCPISQLALNTANHRIFAPVTHFPAMQIVDGTTLNLIGGSTALLTSPPQPQNINGSGTASDSRNQHFYIGAGDQPNNDRVVVLDGNGTQTSGPPSTGGNGCSNISYLTVNPNNQRVYTMANSSSGGACIGMLDGPTNTPVGSLLILAADLGGGGPLVVDTETNRIFALVGGRTIAVIDGATNTLISSTASTYGTTSNAIAINVGLRRLYVSNRDQGTVAVFDIGAGAGSGTISGKVTNSSNQGLSGAWVQFCVNQPNGACPFTGQTDSAGNYFAIGLPAGQYLMKAFPPAGSTGLGDATAGPITLAASQNLTQNITLPNKFPLPTGVTVTQNGVTPPPGVIPHVTWFTPFTLTLKAPAASPGCHYTYHLFDTAGADVLNGPMTESPPGTYTASVPLHPGGPHGFVHVTFTAAAGDPNPPCGPIDGGDVYIDPSGVVQTTGGRPVVGATVTLFRSDTGDANTFVQVPDGSAIMSPGNRKNPDTSDSTGHFGWDVIAGFYTVRAAKTGCGSVDSAILHIVNDPVTNLVLTLNCPGSSLLGDINGDGIVDIRDYGIWRTNFGQTNSGNPADLDGNNIVDIRDYGVWRTNFGHTAPDAGRSSPSAPAAPTGR